MTAAGSAEATTRSMSRTVDRQRRRLPAKSAATTSGSARSASTNRAACGSTTARRRRPAILAGRRGRPALDGPQDVRLGLLSHAREPAQAPFPGGLLQVAEVADARLLPDEPGLLGPHAREAHHRQQPLGVALAQPGEEGDVAGGHVLEDLRLDGLADPRQPPQLALQRHLGDRDRVVAEERGRLLVGEDAVGGLPVQGQVVGDGLKDLRQFCVGGRAVPAQSGSEPLLSARAPATVVCAAALGPAAGSMRKQVWMRGLRAKSGGMVCLVMSATANSSAIAGSSLKRRKLVEKRRMPSGESSAAAERMSQAWSRWMSRVPSMLLELEKVGASRKMRS